MKLSILVIAIATMGCCETRNSVGRSNPAISPDAIAVDTITYVTDTTRPVCIQALIEKFMQEEKQNPPRSIASYNYKGKLVYFVPAICCDFFSDLYDAECKLSGHPDGGFTGRGDGNFPDFNDTRSDEKLIWKDSR